MPDYVQSGKSEMMKVKDPKRCSYNRCSYYTDVEFVVDDKDKKISVKIDTGASYTVFGLKNKTFKNIRDNIRASNMTVRAYDASGSELRLFGYIVNDFKLTQDIMIPKIKVYFSEEIGDKALLGMDIMSLFDFQYLKEHNSTNGTFWINNYIEILNKLQRRVRNTKAGYLDPAAVFGIDNITADDKTREI